MTKACSTPARCFRPCTAAPNSAACTCTPDRWRSPTFRVFECRSTSLDKLDSGEHINGHGSAGRPSRGDMAELRTDLRAIRSDLHTLHADLQYVKGRLEAIPPTVHADLQY